MQLEFLPAAYSRIYLENFRDVPLLSLSSAPDSELRLFFKRTASMSSSRLASLVFSRPCCLPSRRLIRITSPGPVLFRQTRCGLGGRRFTLYKFRSMITTPSRCAPNCTSSTSSTARSSRSATTRASRRLGAGCAASALDELPQLWNVLRGEMSFVGPRPAVPEEVEQYEDWQRRRLRMRPGLTCTWVLEGRSHVDFNRWMQLDLKYIDNWSLWLDAKIFLRTIPIVLSGRGAY